MIKEKDLMILSSLRKNARERLTTMSRRTKIPISTIFDKIRLHEKNEIIKKHATIVDFSKLGYNTRANIAIKVKRDSRDALKNYLMNHPSVNSLFKIGSGYDFLVEGVFTHIKELEDFMEIIEEKFDIKAKDVYYIIDDLKREGFLEWGRDNNI